MTDVVVDGFAPDSKPMLRAAERRRGGLLDGIDLLVRHPSDATAVTLHADAAAGGVAFAKAETSDAVRLLFALDRVATADLATISADGETAGGLTIDWAAFVLVEERVPPIYVRPLREPRLGPPGDRRSFAFTAPVPETAADVELALAVQLGRGAGRLRFRLDPFGRQGDLVAFTPPPIIALSADLLTMSSVERRAELERLELQAADLQARLAEAESAIDPLRASLGLPPRRVAARQGFTTATQVVIGAAAPASRALPLVNWVIGGPENTDWAYGNNARRLAARMPDQRHVIAGEGAADVALYFDPMVADRHPVEATHSVQRIGGPRPLDRLFGDDPEALAQGLAQHAAVVPLNLALHRRCRVVAGKVRFIPNALDLDEWSPDRRQIDPARPFTAGFAASITSRTEAEVKGWPIAQQAAALAGVELVATQRTADGAQMPPDRMLPDFYSKIDVLLHPVASGREGTSNVVMEALACGIPVVCTADAGLHGELLVNERTALIRERSAEAFAHALLLLRHDPKLRDRLGDAARAFAERHHDVATAARRYEQLLEEVLEPARATTPKVSILPFWQPAEAFGSSRLRGLYVARALEAGGHAEVSFDYDPDAEIVIVVQMADDPLMETLRRSHQFVIYDVCDRYFENRKTFRRDDGDVDSLARYEELIERADLVIVPTSELKIEVSSRRPDRPVVHVPEPVDYAPTPGMLSDPGRKTVLWFGNPGRGNFESAKWLLDLLRERHGYSVRIVSKASFFKAHPAYQADVMEWSLDAMTAAFAEASLCVVTHGEGEQTKSPNRMVAAVMQGLPTLVHNSASCEALLREAGDEVAIVASPGEVARALDLFDDPTVRAAHVGRLQGLLSATYGHDAVAADYARLFEDFHFARSARPARIGLVSHNLNPGEGAPRSLLELARGFSARGDEVSVYSAGEGELEALYRAAALPIEVFDRKYNHCTKALNERFGELRTHFREWLQRTGVEVLLCNTAKSAPFAYFARELGLPTLVIVRESFAPEDRFSGLQPEVLLASEIGLMEAEQVLFVAEESRAAWRDFRFEGRVSVIPNGVDPERFSATRAMSRGEARTALGLPADDFIALSVGTIGVRKAQGALVDAFAALPPEVRDGAMLLFAGDATEGNRRRFQERLDAARPTVGDAIRWLPPMEEVGLLYRAADLLLMNSSNEAYPRSTMEALLFGLPVLSTRVFGVMTQIEDGVNGRLYDIGDMVEWSRLFVELRGDGGTRARMGRAAARSFWRHTGKAEMLARYRAVIGRLTAQRRR